MKKNDERREAIYGASVLFVVFVAMAAVGQNSAGHWYPWVVVFIVMVAGPFLVAMFDYDYALVLITPIEDDMGHLACFGHAVALSFMWAWALVMLIMWTCKLVTWCVMAPYKGVMTIVYIIQMVNDEFGRYIGTRD